MSRHAWEPRSVEVGGERCTRCDLKRRKVPKPSVRKRDHGAIVDTVEVFDRRRLEWVKVTGKLPACRPGP